MRVRARRRSGVPLFVGLAVAAWIAGILLTLALTERAGEREERAEATPTGRDSSSTAAAAPGRTPPQAEPARKRKLEPPENPKSRNAARSSEPPKEPSARRRPVETPSEESQARAEPPRPAIHDPLGKNPEPGELSEVDRGRAELAAFRFVDATYDFEGRGDDGRLRYVDAVNATVGYPEEFWQSPRSPGADVLDAVAERIEKEGVRNAATFEAAEIGIETPEGELPVTVRFSLDEGDGEKAYEQRLVLARWGAVWRVMYAQHLKEVSR